jgi:hypothetical protein
MKKVQIAERKFIVISTLIVSGLLANACGSSTNNVSPVTATESSGTTGCTTNCTTTSPGAVYSSCASYGGQLTTVNYGGQNISVCRYIVTESQYGPATAFEMEVTSSGGTLIASGGENTGIQLDQGDIFNVVSIGHYSLSDGVCDGNNGGGDISVLGNYNGKISTNNGENAGLWYAFENTNGSLSAPVNATVQYSSGGSLPNPQPIKVPMGTATNSLVLGYNAQTIQCGTMEAIYSITRCVDANSNTYPCF